MWSRQQIIEPLRKVVTMFFKKEHYVQNVEKARKLGLTFLPKTDPEKMEDFPRPMTDVELKGAGLESTMWIWEDIDRSHLFIPIKPPPAKEEIIIRDLPGDAEIDALCWMGICVCLLILAWLRIS